MSKLKFSGTNTSKKLGIKGSTSKREVLNFATDAYVEFSENPTLTGLLDPISFYLYLDSSNYVEYCALIYSSESSDYITTNEFIVFLKENYLWVQTGGGVDERYHVDITGHINKSIFVEIKRTDASQGATVNYIKIDGVVQTLIASEVTLGLFAQPIKIGGFINLYSMQYIFKLYDATIWDITIPGRNHWNGYVGNLNSGWLDTIGSNNGSVSGTTKTTRKVSVPTKGKIELNNGYEEEALSLINRMISTGEIPSFVRKQAINTCISSLKKNNLFSTQFDVLVVTRGSGTNSTKMNWISNNFNATGVNNPTYTQDVGYNSDGASSYLNTNYNPTTNNVLLSQNNTNFIIKTSGVITASDRYHGQIGGANFDGIVIGTSAHRFNSVGDGGVHKLGYECLTRNNGSNWQTYNNSDVSVNKDAASVPFQNLQVYILACNGLAPGYIISSTEVTELYAMGSYLTQSRFLIFQNIMNTYFANIIYGSSFEPETISLIVREMNAGEEPTLSRATAMNTAIKSLKTNDLFTNQFDVLVVTKGTGVNSTKMNWISNNFNTTGVNNPTYTQDVGYNSDGASSYLNANYNPTTQSSIYLQNDAFWFNKMVVNDTTGSQYQGGSGTAYMADSVTGNDTYGNDSAGYNGGKAITGYNGISRFSSSLYRRLQNSSVNDNISRVTQGMPTLFTMLSNNGGSIYKSTNILEMYGMGKSITQSKFITFQNIMNTYFVSIAYGQDMSSFEQETINLIAREISASETPTFARATAQNTAIKSLKENDLFTNQFDDLVVTRGYGVNSTKMNWISNNFNATGINNPTYTTGVGYSSDGSSSCLNTNYNPSIVGGLYTQNDACWGYKSSGDLGTGTRVNGAYFTYLSYIGVYPNATFNTTGEIGGWSASTGYTCMSRYASNSLSLLKNSTKVDSSYASGGVPGCNFYQLALNNGSVTPFYFSPTTEVQELYFMGKSISQSKFLTFQTIMNTYFTSFGPSYIVDGNTVGWYSIDDTNTIIRNSNNYVSEWKNKVENINLTQPIASKQPHYDATNGIHFDGIDDYLKGIFTLNQPEMIYMVLNPVAAADNFDFYFDGAVDRGAFFRNVSTNLYCEYAGTVGNSNITINYNQFIIARVLFNGTNSYIKINDVTSGTINAGTLNMGGIVLGTTVWFNEYGECYIKEVIIRKVADTIDNETLIYNYLKNKYNM